MCRQTGDLAPRTHNLVRLAEISGLKLSRDALDTLAETNEFVLSGRYPDTTFPTPSAEEAAGHRRKAEEVFQWLMRKL